VYVCVRVYVFLCVRVSVCVCVCVCVCACVCAYMYLYVCICERSISVPLACVWSACLVKLHTKVCMGWKLWVFSGYSGSDAPP